MSDRVRTPGVAVLAATALAAGALWLLGATSAAAPALERSPPTAAYDFFAYYRPNAEYAFARLGHGDLPLWNPVQSLGLPFLATLQTGVLYPPNWLHVLVPAQPAFAALAALHVALAAVFAAGLAGALGAGRIGAAAAGLLYAFSVPVLGAVWTPNTLYTAAWLPAVLWAILRAARRPTLATAAVLALAVALQALAGWPYTLVMTVVAGLALGGLALVARARAEGRLPVASGVALALGAIAGALLAAPQLLPASELVRRSVRAFGTLAEGEAILVAGPHAPGPFLRTLLEHGLNDGIPGFVALALALAAPFVAPRGQRLLVAGLVAVAALALVVSFGDATPVYGWLRVLPLLGDFRFPFRWRLVSTLALTVAAGVAVTALAMRAGRRASWVALGLAVLVVLPAARIALRGQIPFPRASTGARPLAAERVLATLASRRAPGDRDRVLWQTTVETAWADKLGQATGIPALQDLEPVTPAASARFLTFLQGGEASTRDVRVAQGGGARYEGTVPFYGWVGLPEEGARAVLLDLASVRHVVSLRPPAWLVERMPELGEAPPGGFGLFENARALPFARRVVGAEAEPADPQAALERLASPSFDPATTVLLAPLPPALAPGSGDASPDAGETVVERADAEWIEVRTRGRRAAALVVHDADFPGWEATVDGAPASILRANTVFRAVLVPPGEHRVVMRYRPRSFQIGVALAASTLLAGGLALAVRRSGRAAPAPRATDRKSPPPSGG